MSDDAATPLGIDIPRDLRKAPTIHDVARVAGVSIGTVSKALNGTGQLRTQTRERVRAVAEQLRFYPNDLIHSLLRGRTYTVGLLTTDSYGRFSIPLLTGIEDALDAQSISVFLCNGRDDQEREQRYLATLLAKQADGIIVAGRRIDPREPIDLRGAHCPHLYAFAQVRAPQTLCILPDDEQGGRIAVEHLLSLGRRRFAHIGGPLDFEAARLRAAGALQALEAAGLPLSESYIMMGSWEEAWGYTAAAQLLERDSQIDAIFCANDLLARGAIDRLTAQGVHVPDDIAVVGFDNWEIIARATRPPLTTVDPELHELGRIAGRQLLALIDGHHDAGIVRLPCRLVVRASCGSPPSPVE